jgi:IclR family transcriptional regulator, pca regulon regulatory protein
VIASIDRANYFRNPKLDMTNVAAAAMPPAKSLVLSLAKGFRILEVFDGRDTELTLSQIAQRAELDSGTAFRLVKTLVMLGYLRQVENAKRYYLGLKVLDLGFHAISRMDLHASARPVLRGLVGQLNEAASIGVLDGSHVVYIERVQAGLARLGVNVRVGSRIPAYCTALGHSILAHLPFEQRVGILNLQERVKLTPRTLVTIPEIEERLEQVRRAGYALSDQDTVSGLRVLAVPILDADGHPYAGVSVAAPSVACSLQDFVNNSAGPVQQAAKDLGRILSLAGASVMSV